MGIVWFNSRRLITVSLPRVITPIPVLIYHKVQFAYGNYVLCFDSVGTDTTRTV